MRLLADRFLINGDDPVIDLATGASVVITAAAAGSAPEQLQWTLRCDRWRTLQHRAIAPLLDFGLSGERDRFEAWHRGPAWDGAVSEAESACAVAAQFIGAAGMSVGANCRARDLSRSERRPDRSRHGNGLPQWVARTHRRRVADRDARSALHPAPCVRRSPR